MKAAPERPLVDEGTAFERQLLESARTDAIPAASLERLARALSVPSSAPAGQHPAPLRVARQGSLLKLGAWGLIGAVAATAIGWRISESRDSAQFVPARDAYASAASESAVSESAVSESSASSAAESAVSDSAVSERAVVERAVVERLVPEGAEGPTAAASDRASVSETPPRRATRPARALAADTGGLRAELVAVEAIQGSLRAGRTGDAERQLTDYERRFPRGELALEAELLRIDLDVARNELDRARARARMLLTRSDAARYRRRLEALTQTVDSPQSARRAVKPMAARHPERAAARIDRARPPH